MIKVKPLQGTVLDYAPVYDDDKEIGIISYVYISGLWAYYPRVEEERCSEEHELLQGYRSFERCSEAVIQHLTS